jgi:hypothetical protein
VTCAGIELLTIWEVRARAGYHVGGEGARHDSHVRITKGGQNCVALGTVRGSGRLQVSGKEFEVTEGSLLLFDLRALENHGASGKTRDFCWFEFRRAEPRRRPMLTVMRAPALETEEENCRGIFEPL